MYKTMTERSLSGSGKRKLYSKQSFAEMNNDGNERLSQQSSTENVALNTVKNFSETPTSHLINSAACMDSQSKTSNKSKDSQMINNNLEAHAMTVDVDVHLQSESRDEPVAQMINNTAARVTDTNTSEVVSDFNLMPPPKKRPKNRVPKSNLVCEYDPVMSSTFIDGVRRTSRKPAPRQQYWTATRGDAVFIPLREYCKIRPKTKTLITQANNSVTRKKTERQVDLGRIAEDEEVSVHEMNAATEQSTVNEAIQCNLGVANDFTSYISSEEEEVDENNLSTLFLQHKKNCYNFGMFLFS